MPNTPPPVRSARIRNVDQSSQRDDSLGGFEKKPSEQTMRRTQYAKSFLEDYYKHLAVPDTTITTNTTVSTTAVAVQPTDSKSTSETNERGENKKQKGMTLRKKFIKKFMGSPKVEAPFEITEPTSFSHTSHVGISQGGLETQNLPDEMKDLIEKLNASLSRLGARSLSDGELKSLLAQPEFYKHVEETSQSIAKVEPIKPKRKLSATIAQKMGLQSSTDTTNIQIGSPVNFVKVSGFNFSAGDNPSSLKMKLDLADRALQHESELRTAAEQRSADLSFSISKMQIEFERLSALSRAREEEQQRVTELSKMNKHQEMELAMWKKRLFTQTQRAEDNLAVEVQRRRDAESKYLELLAQKTNNNSNNNNNNNVVKVQEALAEKQAELAKLVSQFEHERAILQAENESLRRELEEANTRTESERKNWENQRVELLSRMDAVKIDCVKKTDEAVRRLEVERQQRRIDQMMIETLSKTNAEYQTQIEMIIPPAPSSAACPTEVKRCSPPPAPPLPDRMLSKNTSSTGMDQAMRTEISSVKLQPTKNRDTDGRQNRMSPPTGLDALVLAILARRGSVANENGEDGEQDGADDFDD